MYDRLRIFISSTRFRTSLWYSGIFLLLEILFGIIVYISLYNSLLHRLDTSLKNQANAILRTVTEKRMDIENFRPDSVYQSPSDLVWDIIYDEVILNQRNNFIQIFYKSKIIFKSSNLIDDTLSFPLKKGKYNIFDFTEPELSAKMIRVAQLNENNYNIIVAYPLENISQTLSSLVQIYILLAPLFFIVALIGGILISAKALSRIDAIIKKTEEITALKLEDNIEGGNYSDEYGRLVRKMNEMIKRIKTSVDYANQFSISAAHELKTPLTILRGETEIALRSKKTTKEYASVLKSNYEEIIRLTKIIDNLFFISKIDNSLIKIQKEIITLNDYLEPLINSLMILGKEKNIKIVLKSRINPKIEIDKILMTQAITNLIDNAIKYGNENENIIITTEKFTNNRVKISIVNKGEVIPEESKEKIYDRFYRIESSRNRKTGGAGLGLSVVKSIMNWHEADISINSDKGDLTTVVFTLNIAS
jgi:signal transduction histidine kinase